VLGTRIVSLAHQLHSSQSMTFAQVLSVILLGGSVFVAALLHAHEAFGAERAGSLKR